MKTNYGHLTYCSNIHPGENWTDHFAELRQNVPYIRSKTSGTEALAIGLRLANEASLELAQPDKLSEFKKWLADENLYVFCINGFPYGSFHDSVVKGNVHLPDWTTRERVDYTKRLFRILASLIPDGMHGAVSTPPLSYRPWWGAGESLAVATEKASQHIIEVLDFLLDLKTETRASFHLDLEPEPDGILDNGADFFRWYEKILLPEATAFLMDARAYTATQAREAVLEHIQLCYDVCHFAISYESPKDVLKMLAATGIRVGRIQISSALRVDWMSKKDEKLSALSDFNEPVYLHQVVARTAEGNLERFSDLDQALATRAESHAEWRVHFHVPLFIAQYGLLSATQSDIVEVLKLQKMHGITSYLEIETYTWGVLPQSLQIPIADSIVRELDWVLRELEN
jgi:sugar phosphate isomerase/epimerase